jgi:putative acetyltransferase
MPIEIRSYDTPDAEPLLSLFHDTVHEINSRDYLPEQLEAWAPAHPDVKRWRERFKESKTYVAVANGKIIGFGNLENNKQSIGMLYVHKDYQGMGAATLLLNKLEAYLIKKGVALTSVEASITARTFFEQKGYAWVRDNRKMLNGKEFLNFILEKRLAFDEAEKAPEPMKQEKMEKPEKPEKHKKEKDHKEKGKRFSWRDLFLNKVFDLLIVIAGVTIAFQLNNLKNQSDANKLERFYLENMVADLDKDIEKIQEVSKALEADRQVIHQFLPTLDRPEPSADTLALVVTDVMEFETFRGHQDTYTNLLAGNGLSNLGSAAIRNQISDYYKQYVSVARFEQVYTEVVYQMIRHFSPYTDLAKRKIVDESVVKMVQSRNMLLIAEGQLNNGTEDYAEMLKKAKALRDAISALLANP